MVRLVKYILAVVFTYLSLVVVSQNETKKWYFGANCALDFMTSPPTPLTNGVMTTWEGCASVADASGNLLFYTNGVKIWNQTHVLMANGTGLSGDNSSAQSALIVKQPGSTGLYFVFTTDGAANGLRYSVVDMSLAAGMGSVTVKNILVSASSTERLCGTRHCNGKDVWVISHEMSSDVFHANLVTAAGVNTTAVVSAAGSSLNGMNSIGSMKASPNGKKLGMSLYSSSFELFDFDPSTGIVSNPLSLPVNAAGYGCEFSPDGTKFYGTIWGPGVFLKRLCQWDLCAGSDPAIVASASYFAATHTGQLQLAPDGKIYQARATFKSIKVSPGVYMDVMNGEPSLGVIHNPNAGATALNFNNTAQAVNPSLSMFGLPNFVSGFYKTPVAQFSYSVAPAISCVKAFFTAPPLINAACPATSYTVSNVKWLFGDPASATADSSVLLNPDHTYPGIGAYTVRLILYNFCGGVIDTLRQQVQVGGALTNNATAFSICTGQSTTLTAAGATGSYSWSTGATTASIVITPTVTTTYSLSYTDTFGCPRSSVQTVTVNSLPTITLAGKDTICTGAVITKTVSGALTYSWSTGSTNSAISVTPVVTTTYAVTGTAFNGCSVSKVFTGVVKFAPVPTVTGDTVICAGNEATVVASAPGATKYYWNTGTLGPTLTLVPADEHWIFSVKATYTNGCTRYKVVRFDVKLLPYVTVAGNTIVCPGAVVTQTADGASTYSWSNGMTTNPAELSPLTNTTYTVTGTDINNCVRTATVFIAVKPSSAPNAWVSGDLKICEGKSTVLSARGGDQYDWQLLTNLVKQQDTLVIVSPPVSTVYSVTVSNNGGCGTTKTVQVSVQPKPDLWAGQDTTFNIDAPMSITASGSGTITWIGGEGISCKVCRHTRIFPTVRTCYQAQAINGDGCIATDEVCVDISREHAVYMPGTFTPNGDGLNDVFFVNGFGISVTRLNIFDRWGEKLFATNSEAEGWNGNYKGQRCQEGVYNWVLDYVSVDGEKHQQTGSVNLLR